MSKKKWRQRSNITSYALRDILIGDIRMNPEKNVLKVEFTRKQNISKIL